ncbi:MAG: hypothetical protein H2172_03985 [Opitutus sp.]|nr:hypothetical protein [Opitutus sp.]MCS6246389.1 hypothetical protein [Opitutus sp.]MCS6273247.1 hypothetical protein [Opitutus sp.]MCS6277977.1 hypothetical protein [Opitutus sp.]MCS6298916.1 hypothetical protein [Opitutus sp.]
MPIAADLKPVEQARAWLAHQPPAVSGQDGHRATLRVASLLRIGFRLGEGEVAALLADYSRTCLPPWSEREQAHKVASAFSTVPRHALGFMLAPERPTITRAKPVASSVRRISLGAPLPAQPTPPAPAARLTPAEAPPGIYCSACWANGYAAPVCACDCPPWIPPVLPPEQIEEAPSET